MGSFLDRWILQILTEGAAEIAQNARKLASWSSTIPDAIEVGEAKVTADGYSIAINLNVKTAPQAAAFEFGSGIHSTRGPRGTYEIKPRNASVLAIPRFRWIDFEDPVIPGEKIIGEGDRGLLLRRVDHPGVAARPFVQPAFDAYRFNWRKRILLALKGGLSVEKRVEIIS